MGKFKDLTRMKFGKLTVEKYNGIINNRSTWLCKCDCGNDKIAYAKLLLNGECKSCGCLIHESKLKGVRKYENKYEIHNDYSIIKTKDNKEILIDTEYLNELLNYTWMVDERRGSYAFAIINEKPIFMHRYILKAPSDMVVDHINRNKFDNRKMNLRICKHEINSKNCNIHKNNTSLVSGVNYRKDNDKWVARINDKWNRIYLGQFDTFEDAVDARYLAEIELGYLNPNNPYQKQMEDKL